MKLAAVLKLAVDAGLPADKVASVEASIIAADKAAKDAAEGKEKDCMDKRAADRKARDEKRAEDRKARDKARDEKCAADRKARDEKRAADRKARDEKFGAEDRNDDPEGTNDAEMKAEAEDEEKAEKEAEDEDYVSGADPETPGGNRAGGKTAVDSAEVDRRIAAAVAARDALHTAREEVAPIVGKVAHDSAAAVYRAALDKLGVDHKGVDDSALRSLVTLAKDRTASPIVTDSALSESAMTAAIPGFDRLK